MRQRRRITQAEPGFRHAGDARRAKTGTSPGLASKHAARDSAGGKPLPIRKFVAKTDAFCDS